MFKVMVTLDCRRTQTQEATMYKLRVIFPTDCFIREEWSQDDEGFGFTDGFELLVVDMTSKRPDMGGTVNMPVAMFLCPQTGKVDARLLPPSMPCQTFVRPCHEVDPVNAAAVDRMVDHIIGIVTGTLSAEPMDALKVIFTNGIGFLKDSLESLKGSGGLDPKSDEGQEAMSQSHRLPQINSINPDRAHELEEILAADDDLDTAPRSAADRLLEDLGFSLDDIDEDDDR
jgi:hypothetical protein